MNKISIIIVNWNSNNWLEECLRSLQEQTFQDFELIVVDNNSEKNQWRVLKNFVTIQPIKKTNAYLQKIFI